MARIAVALLAAALLAAGIQAAAVRGLADAHYTNARLLLAGGTPANRAPPRPDAVAAALASMEQALALEPWNPHFVEQSARLQELRALALPQGGRATRDGLRQSLAQYREAAAMRPGSPYVWSSIALLKLRLAELDYEFYNAFERAGRLGAWEPQVQIAMIDIGLAAWKWLSRPGKDWTLGALERGLLRQAAEVQRLASVHGSLPQVCAEAGGAPFPRIAALCVRK
jgi:hypothetical protein